MTILKKNKNIDITFIIAVLYLSKNLNKTIDSIYKIKTKLEYEVIIMNSSAEGNLKLKKNLKLYNIKDNGIYDAWNYAIEKAKGTYIAFLGDDDILLKDYFKIYSETIYESNKYDYIYSDLIGRDSKRIYKDWNFKKIKKFMKIPHTGCLHKKKIFRIYGKFDRNYKICSDYDFFLRTNDQLKTKYISLPTVKIGEDGMSRKKYFLALKETYLIKKKHKTNNDYLLLLELLIALCKRVLKNLLKLK